MKATPHLALAAGAALALIAPIPHAQAAGHCVTRSFEVFFPKERSAVSPEIRQSVTEGQQSFQGCVVDHVRVIGSTEGKLDASYNLRLAKRRADRVVEVLVQGGWPRERIQVIPIGPAGSNPDEGAQPHRRAVRVVVEARPS